MNFYLPQSKPRGPLRGSSSLQQQQQASDSSSSLQQQQQASDRSSNNRQRQQQPSDRSSSNRQRQQQASDRSSSNRHQQQQASDRSSSNRQRQQQASDRSSSNRQRQQQASDKSSSSLQQQQQARDRSSSSLQQQQQARDRSSSRQRQQQASIGKLPAMHCGGYDNIMDAFVGSNTAASVNNGLINISTLLSEPSIQNKLKDKLKNSRHTLLLSKIKKLSRQLAQDCRSLKKQAATGGDCSVKTPAISHTTTTSSMLICDPSQLRKCLQKSDLHKYFFRLASHSHSTQLYEQMKAEAATIYTHPRWKDEPKSSFSLLLRTFQSTTTPKKKKTTTTTTVPISLVQQLYQLVKMLAYNPSAIMKTHLNFVISNDIAKRHQQHQQQHQRPIKGPSDDVFAVAPIVTFIVSIFQHSGILFGQSRVGQNVAVPHPQEGGRSTPEQQVLSKRVVRVKRLVLHDFLPSNVAAANSSSSSGGKEASLGCKQSKSKTLSILQSSIESVILLDLTNEKKLQGLGQNTLWVRCKKTILSTIANFLESHRGQISMIVIGQFGYSSSNILKKSASASTFFEDHCKLIGKFPYFCQI